MVRARRTNSAKKSRRFLIKIELWKCTSRRSTAGISLVVLIRRWTRRLERSEYYPRTLKRSYVLCSEWKTQNLRARKAGAWPNVSTVRNRPTNFFSRKAGKSTTTDSSPGAISRKAKPPTKQPYKHSKSRSIRRRPAKSTSTRFDRSEEHTSEL